MFLLNELELSEISSWV